ncbi:polysaccharide pyruvyl transferase family protein [Dorea sp.]
MKKILLVTLHSQNNNFGSVLQAHSLYKYMEDLGFDVNVLNYQPYYSNGASTLQSFIRKIAINTIFFPFLVVRTHRFNQIINQSRLTKLIKKYDDIDKSLSDYDIFMIGSDQVWNPHYLCGQDDTYFLKFTNSKNKVSYAASIGTTDLTKQEIVNIVNNIKEFKYVSLREEESSVCLKNNGRRDAEYVLDPVFLQSLEYYKSLASKSKISVKKGYVLAYVIHKDDFIEKVIKEFSTILNKPVIQVGGFAKKCDYAMFPRSAGPQEFLALIEGADFVITSSFHGTAFAHIFEKQFAVVMPSGNKLRLENILRTAGTEDRVVEKISDVNKMLENINYGSVRERLDNMKRKSQEYLDKVLNG